METSIAKRQLLEMLQSNFLTHSSLARIAAFDLVANGACILGKYTGSGRFTRSSVANISFMQGLVAYTEHNDAPRGGVHGMRASLVSLSIPAIAAKYAEYQAEAVRRRIVKQKQAAKRKQSAKIEAEKYGFKTVAALHRAKSAYAAAREKHKAAAENEAKEGFLAETGSVYNPAKIADRVGLARMTNYPPFPTFAEFIKQN